MRISSGSASRGRAASRCCIAIAHDSAAAGPSNATIRPSPRFFTSRPPDSATAFRNDEKCSRRNSSACSSPTRDSNSVEPTRSVNRTVIIAVVICPPRLSARRCPRKRNALLPGLSLDLPVARPGKSIAVPALLSPEHLPSRGAEQSLLPSLAAIRSMLCESAGLFAGQYASARPYYRARGCWSQSDQERLTLHRGANRPHVRATLTTSTEQLGRHRDDPRSREGPVLRLGTH